MRYTIPYFEGIAEYLKQHEEILDRVEDVYFADSNFLPSCRNVKLRQHHWKELQTLNKDLNIRLHYVFNPTVYLAEIYVPSVLKRICERLEVLSSRGVGSLTVSNTVLLMMPQMQQILSKFDLKNSVNNDVLCLEDVRTIHEDFGLKYVMLSANVNRDRDELERISKYAKQHNVRLTLLANEGCLHQCPHRKQDFDMEGTLVQLSHDSGARVEHFFSSKACHVVYGIDEADALRTPFLSPDMFDDLEGVVDVIKLIGRKAHPMSVRATLDSLWNLDLDNVRVFGGFITKDYGPTLGQVTVGQLRKAGFQKRIVNCKNRCAECGFCQQVYNEVCSEPEKGAI